VDHDSATRTLKTGSRWNKPATGISEPPQGVTMVAHQSALMRAEFEKGLSSSETQFLANLESLAPDVRGSFYFNKKDESKILGGGHLLSYSQREARFGEIESKTTPKNITELGNQDHVFFFLEHKDDPFKLTRFADESSESGKARKPRKTARSTGDERRLRVPLAGLMHPGTWAMGRDFLGVDRTDDNYKGVSKVPDRYNFIAGGAGDTGQEQARHLLRGMGLTAIQRMRTLTNKEAQPEMLAATGQDLMSVVNRHLMSPQLQVPGGVSLHTEGAEIERQQPGRAFSARKKFGE
jgi:hypothetical protein